MGCYKTTYIQKKDKFEVLFHLILLFSYIWSPSSKVMQKLNTISTSRVSSMRRQMANVFSKRGGLRHNRHGVACQKLNDMHKTRKYKCTFWKIDGALLTSLCLKYIKL